ncbi:MAG: replication endonuclease [Methyloprofundus sp.]|nr:replication endonuclease [Methyloprofundus sp.]
MSAMIDYKAEAKAIEQKHAADYLAEVLEILPWGFRKFIPGEYWKIYKREGFFAANLFLTGLKDQAKKISYRLALDDDQLINEAEASARMCESFLINAVGDYDLAWYMAEAYAINKRVELPDTEKLGVYPAMMRLTDGRWWRRALRKVHARGLETLAIKANAVHVRRSTYASVDTVKRRGEQKARNARILENIKAVNEVGDEYSLAELAALNVSNPSIRRAELMTRIAGFQVMADQQGHVGEFYTWTAPSKYHAVLSRSGARNPKFKGYTPRETQAYLSKQWAKARAELKRAGIKPYGFRVVEPHHDATPHWHMLFFMPFGQVLKCREILRRYALEVDGDEEGAQKQRFKAVAIDKSKGTAAGYIAKYIAKAIDGFKLDADLYGNTANDAARNIEAWASTWNIRQFQQIGGASVTVWRELRRLKAEDTGTNEFLERARAAADRGDWAEYCNLNDAGQIALMLSDETETGRYGDVKQKRVIGIQTAVGNLLGGSDEVITRVHTWIIGQPNQQAEGAQSAQGEAAAPWSTVNNCTEDLKKLEQYKRMQTTAYEEFRLLIESGDYSPGKFDEFYEEWLYERGF